MRFESRLDRLERALASRPLAIFMECESPPPAWVQEVLRPYTVVKLSSTARLPDYYLAAVEGEGETLHLRVSREGVERIPPPPVITLDLGDRADEIE